MSNSGYGKWIVLAVVGAAIWIGVRPLFLKKDHWERSGKEPKPLVIDTTGIPEGYQNLAREGKPYQLPKDLQGGSSSSGNKISADDFRERFHRSIVDVPKQGSASEVPADPDLEARMKNISQLCVMGNDADGLKAADDFLAFLENKAGVDPQYKVATAALATQMADRSQQRSRAKEYSDIAYLASRSAEDYLIEKIEPVYFGLRGSTVDFVDLQKNIQQYEKDSDSGNNQDLLSQAKRIAAATESLPEGSFFRLKSRIFLAHSQLSMDRDTEAAVNEFRDIQKSAQAGGDLEMAKHCGIILSTIQIAR